MDGKEYAKAFGEVKNSREVIPSKNSALPMRSPPPTRSANLAPFGVSHDKTNEAPPPRRTYEGEIRSTDTKWPGAPKRQLRVDDPAYCEPCPPPKHARPDVRKSKAAAAAAPPAGAAPKSSADVAAAFVRLGRQRRKEKEDAERRRREEQDFEKPVVPKEEPKKETGQPANTQPTLDMINSMAPRGMCDYDSPMGALKPLEEISLPPRPHQLQPQYLEEPFGRVLPCKAMSHVGQTDEDEDWEHLSSDSSDSEDDTDTVGEWEML